MIIIRFVRRIQMTLFRPDALVALRTSTPNDDDEPLGLAKLEQLRPRPVNDNEHSDKTETNWHIHIR